MPIRPAGSYARDKETGEAKLVDRTIPAPAPSVEAPAEPAPAEEPKGKAKKG